MILRISNASKRCDPILSLMSLTSSAHRSPPSAVTLKLCCTPPPANPEDSRQFLEIIGRHSDRLSRLTEDLLTLSDLEAGKVQLTLQPLDAGYLIQRVLEVFWDQASKKKIKLFHHVPAELPKLLGDLDRLQ